MLASGVHTNVDEPPAASMFSHSKRQRPDTGDDVFHGMMSVMNTLCNVVSNRQVCDNKPLSSAGASPIKKAELGTTYMKQLSDPVAYMITSF